MRGKPVTQKAQPPRKHMRLHVPFAIVVAVVLLSPNIREIIFSGFWYAFGTALGVIIGMFLFLGGTRMPRR